MVEDVLEVGPDEPEVDRHEHCPDLRHGVERLEMSVRVRRDVRDAIATPDAEPLERARPSVAASEEALVGQPKGAINDGFALRMQLTRAPREIDGGERNYHVTPTRDFASRSSFSRRRIWLTVRRP